MVGIPSISTTIRLELGLHNALEICAAAEHKPKRQVIEEALTHWLTARGALSPAPAAPGAARTSKLRARG